MADLESFIGDLLLESTCCLENSDFEFSAVLKAAGIRIIDNYSGLLEKLTAYMGFVREYLGDRLFIFVNLRNFISNEDYELLITEVANQSFKLLLIESQEYPSVEREKRLIIDNDFCEI